MALRQLTHSIRSLLRAPGLTCVAVLAIALGVGAGTSLFSVVKAVLLNPLPFPRADRLIWISEVNSSGRPMNVALPNFEDWSRQNHTFDSMAAFASEPVKAGANSPRRIVAAVVTPGFFRTMGLQPSLGRDFLASEHVEGAPLAAIIGHGFWQREYGGDPSVLGRSIRLGGYSATVIGVMPAGFSYPESAEVWLSALALGDNGTRTAHNFRVVGRLKSGIAIEQAQADLSEVARRLKRQYPDPYMAKDAVLVPLLAHVAGKVRPALLILFAAVGLLMLIVCVNIANLLLVRVTARARELAVRLALGAGRAHLLRQMLAESVLLAAGGGLLGFLLAFWSMDLLKLLLPPDVPRASEIRIDWVVFAFALAVSAAAGLLFGLFPAWRATRLNVHDAMKAGAHSVTPSRGARVLQSSLVVCEICLSLALLAGAGLLVNSFIRLRSVDPGFRADHVLVANLFFNFPKSDADRSRLVDNYADLLARVRAMPGVESAGTGSDLPLDGAPDGNFRLDHNSNPGRTLDADYAVISPGYLEALRIPLIAGRDLTEADSANAPGVAVITAEMAREFFPERNPLGERIWYDSFEQREHWLTIVGIAADAREEGLTRPYPPLTYVCYAQAHRLASASLVVRTHADPAVLAGPIRDALRAVNPEAASAFTTMQRKLNQTLAQQRFQMQVLGGFAALALLLAGIGIYGVLSYMVARSRGEIGIRMALGAPPSSVFRAVTLRALILAIAGVSLGLGGFMGVRKVLASVLFGVTPGDPLTLALAIATLLAIAMLAAVVPARRAMRTDPMTALRDE
jgi:putative ABC transport system permease protein